MYGSFVKLCNAALDGLKNHEAHPALARCGFRACDDLDIVFCRNAGKAIEASYANITRHVQRPNVVITSRQAATSIYGLQSATGAENTLCDEPPPTSFTWQHVLSTMEFKRFTSEGLAVPERYTTIMLQRDMPAVNDIWANRPPTTTRAKRRRSSDGKHQV